MPNPTGVRHQLQLFRATPDFDGSFASVVRVHLGADSWVDCCRGWMQGADQLFRRVVEERTWGQRTRRVWDQVVREPRLTSHWSAAGGTPLTPEPLESVRAALSRHYGVRFDSAGFNLYRDGRDSVAWHGDKIAADIAAPIVALLSLGAPRRFLLRPHGGGASIRFLLGDGDLLVTGGRTQRDWEHCVPKVARAAPRISIAFRHGALRPQYETSTASKTQGLP